MSLLTMSVAPKFCLMTTLYLLVNTPEIESKHSRPEPGELGGVGTYCRDPGTIINGWRKPKSGTLEPFIEGDQVSFHCYASHRMSGQEVMTCKKNGQWEPATPPKCTAAFCPVPSIDHGRVIQKLGAFYEGQSATIMCDPGYHLIKPVSITCGANRKWSSELGTNKIPRCIEDRPCGAPPPLRNGRAMFSDRDPRGPKYMHGHRILYRCRPGYFKQLRDDNGVQCDQGEWRGLVPKCIPYCPNTPLVRNSANFITYIRDGRKYAYIDCKPDFVLKGKSTMECVNGQWSRPLPTCVRPSCKNPKGIQNGFYKLQDGYENNAIDDGTRVSYSCIEGYRLQHETQSMMECVNGVWEGQLPECVKRTHCDEPANKRHAHWIILGTHGDFRIGSRVMYECDEEYKAVGNKEVECLPSGYWSSDPPTCLSRADNCDDPGSLKNGLITCTPKHCAGSDFKVGSQIEYICMAHFEAVGQVSRTCEKGGKWSGSAPICVPLDVTSGALQTHGTTPALPQSLQESGIPNISTLTIVIATSCSVLGVLLIVMVVVAFHRRKPNTRLCHPVQPPPPPYTRPRTNSVEEHDRLALIAFADGVQVVLPSYDEATRGRGATRQLSSSGSSTSRSSRGSGQNEYRPLPSIPSNLRGRQDSVRSGPQIRELPSSESHRNSTITVASTATRDNLSEVFGSIDTVNAMSDGTSTSVTIETYDSTVSNPSIAASQRATAGSIASLTGSDANEDAPLIVEQSNTDAISLSESLPVSEETKEE